MNSNFIVIEGNIGTGKSSFVRKFSDKKNFRPVYEQFADNPFLPDFYKDPEKLAFTVEMSFLAKRYHQLHEEIYNSDLFYNGVAADYHLSKSLIFARATLQEREFKLFRDVFNIINQKTIIPDLYVYLHKSVSSLKENIIKRGREYEKNINKDYLKKIENSYFEFFRQHPEIPVIVINTENMDFIGNRKHFNELVKKIMESLNNKTL